MVTDLPTSINGTRSRDDHIADHARLHLNLQQSVYSADYASLQLAIDDAISKNRPLVIAPGTQNIAAPLQIYGASQLNIVNLGLINPTTNMDAVFDICGVNDFSLRGGVINIPTGVVVQDAIHVYSDTNITGVLTKRPYVGHIKIQRAGTGYFVNGLRVGIAGSTLQCDEGFFERIGMSGLTGSSEKGIQFVGISNNLNHLVQACYANNCNVAFETSGVNAITWIGNNADGPQTAGSVAYQIASVSNTIIGGRIESCDKLYYETGSSTGGFQRILHGVLFVGNSMVGNNWIDVAGAGDFDLHVHCNAPAVEPHIKVNTPSQLWLSGKVTISSDANRPSAANLVDGVNARGSLTYIQNASGPSFVSGEVVALT